MIVNKVTTHSLTDIDKIDPHIQKMNNEGWELFAMFQQAIGIKEVLILLWRRDTNAQ